MSDGLRVANVEPAGRYVLTRDGVQIGFVEYRLDPPDIALTYIEIDPALRGEGLGEKLAVEVLEDCRARGLKVMPRCGWMAGYMRANHERYADLLAN
jgi:hypothetical protein